MATTQEFIIETKRPKAFDLPTINMITWREPTDAYVLWIVSNCKYAFNPLYTGQFVAKNPELASADSNLTKATKIVDGLITRKYLRKDTDFNLYLTCWGHLHRLKQHAVSFILGSLISVFVAVILFLISRQCTPTHPTKEQTHKLLKTEDTIFTISSNDTTLYE